MSVLIKGMDMPTSCADCRFYGEYCYAKGDENRYSKLPCPLSPFQTTGMPIDNSLWVSVKERLPEPYILVLVTDGKKVLPRWRGDLSETWFSDVDRFDDVYPKIIYWMPFPELPKED